MHYLALFLILILPGCSSLKDKRVSIKCKCSWDYPYYVVTPPPKDHTP
jgi:hypothetical protein